MKQAADNWVAMNWIGALFLAALLTVGFAFYSDIAITRCTPGSVFAAVGLCSTGFK